VAAPNPAPAGGTSPGATGHVVFPTPGSDGRAGPGTPLHVDLVFAIEFRPVFRGTRAPLYRQVCQGHRKYRIVSQEIFFRRELNEQQRRSWSALMDKLMEVNLSSSEDLVVWALEKTGVFSTRSLYKFLSFGGGS
jgi:hypothetical protein